jgi:hypothetical protein
MELHTYLKETPDYESDFRRLGLQVKKRKGLLLVKYPYDMDLSEMPEWVRFCRGAIIDTETNRLVCVPPVKAEETTFGDQLIPPEGCAEDSGKTEYQVLADGTMMNLFCHRGEWILATRGSIGARNKWDDNLSFYDMFQECGQIDYGTLDQRCGYSFVMKHIANRVVSPVSYNAIYLVEIYRYSEDADIAPERLSVQDFPESSFQKIETFDPSECDLTQEIPYYCKGFTVKHGSKRTKTINPNYRFVQDLKPNTNNAYLNYLELRQNGNLKMYLKYFPEHVHPFNEYRDNIHKLTNDLYTTYKNVHIHKTKERKDIPYHLKPLTYEVHGNYLDSKKPTTWQDIKQYVHELPPKKLMFALNYSDHSS